jgi:hypothetical protein
MGKKPLIRLHYETSALFGCLWELNFWNRLLNKLSKLVNHEKKKKNTIVLTMSGFMT